MSTLTKWIVGLGSLIALVIIAIPIYYYCDDFRELPRSSIPSEWGAFGDFIGGILNPFISLLTLIVTISVAFYVAKIEKRNHEETVHGPVRPYLTLKSGQFFTSFSPGAGQYWDEYYFTYKPPEGPNNSLDHLTHNFYLKVSNKGLGVATEVSVTYQIDLQAIRNMLTINTPGFTASSTEIRQIDKEQGDFIFLNTNFNNGQYTHSTKLLAKETAWIGLIDKSKKGNVRFSSQIIAAFKIYEAKRKMDIPIEEFPPTLVTFEYKNIYGKLIVERFRVGFFHMRNFPNFSEYRLLQERID